MRSMHLIALLAAALMTSCSSLRSLMPGQRAAEEKAVVLQELQLKVMRFADEYVGRVNEPIRQFQATATSADERLAAQNWRLSQATSAYTIASGANSITNALDMVVMATLSRMVLEDTWVKELYGNRASGLLEAHRLLEPRAWTLLDQILTPEQLDQLHSVINAWRAQNPRVRAVAYIHFVDFARTIGQPSANSPPGRGSLFALLGLDPLSNLDPAVREITQTRQLAERTIYYMQRAPNLLDMQVERLAYQLAVAPEARNALLNADRIGLAAESAGRLAADLPGVVATERAAAIDQLMAALSAQESRVRLLAAELKGTLDAGTGTADALTNTARSVDSMMSRFENTKGNPTSTTAGRPFDIREYTQMITEVAQAARDLQALVEQLNAASAGIDHLTAAAAGSIHDAADYAFWRMVQLVIVAVATCTCAALLYRLAVTRIQRRRFPRNTY